MSAPALSPPLAGAMAEWPEPARAAAGRIRELIYATAEETGAGRIEESLKWGQPSFSNGRAGTPVRLGYKAGETLPVRVHVHCGTDLVDQYRSRFGGLAFEGNRGICLSDTAPLPEDTLKTCIALALSYHQRKARDG